MGLVVPRCCYPGAHDDAANACEAAVPVGRSSPAVPSPCCCPGRRPGSPSSERCRQDSVPRNAPTMLLFAAINVPFTPTGQMRSRVLGGAIGRHPCDGTPVSRRLGPIKEFKGRADVEHVDPPAQKLLGSGGATRCEFGRRCLLLWDRPRSDRRWKIIIVRCY